MRIKNKPVVLVTGATGRIGHLVVEELLHTNVTVRALTRRPENAALPASVEVIEGDFTFPSSLDPALKGASAVFFVWATAVATAAAVIEKLSADLLSLPRHVVYLSSPHQTEHPFFQQPNPMRELQVEIERLLTTSNLELTILRPGMFASNALHWWAPQIRNGNVVRWPYASVETAPIDERDIAAVAVRTLLESQKAGGDYSSPGLSHLARLHRYKLLAMQ